MPSRRPDPADTIVLVGLMGSGKSTTARLLSQRLGLPMTDSDGYLREHYDSTAAEIVAAEGTEALHAREREHVLAALAGPPCVIAAAASVVTDAGVRAKLTAAFTVFLDVPEAVLAQRMRSGDHRPDFDPVQLRYERIACYLQVATLVISVGKSTPEQVARFVLNGRGSPS